MSFFPSQPIMGTILRRNVMLPWPSAAATTTPNSVRCGERSVFNRAGGSSVAFHTSERFPYLSKSAHATLRPEAGNRYSSVTVISPSGGSKFRSVQGGVLLCRTDWQGCDNFAVPPLRLQSSLLSLCHAAINNSTPLWSFVSVNTYGTCQHSAVSFSPAMLYIDQAAAKEALVLSQCCSVLG